MERFLIEGIRKVGRGFVLDFMRIVLQEFAAVLKEFAAVLSLNQKSCTSIVALSFQHKNDNFPPNNVKSFTSLPQCLIHNETRPLQWKQKRNAQLFSFHP
jgi:hypothetical protein